MVDAEAADLERQFREAVLALSDCVCVSRVVRDRQDLCLQVAAWVTNGRIRPPGAETTSIVDIQVFNGVCVLRKHEDQWQVDHGAGQLILEKSFPSLSAALEFIKAEIEDYWRR